MGENIGILANPAGSHSEDTAQQVAKYLQGAVGQALADGIAATIKAKPQEPQLFLSRWLLRYVEESKRRLAHSKAHKESCISRAAAAARRKAQAVAAAATVNVDERCLNASDKEVIERLRTAEWVEQETISGLLNHLKVRLGATGVYLAKYDDQAALRDGELVGGLRYVAADQDNTYMLNNCLFEDEGVTWELLHEDEAEEGPAESPDVSEEEEEGDELRSHADGQDTDPGASGSSTEGQTEKAIRHKVLLIEEVMDNPRIRFFGLTRPGSYAAVSVEFSEVASAASIASLCRWMQESQQREEAIAAELESVAAAEGNRRGSKADSSEVEDGGAIADEEVEEDEEVEAAEPLPPVQLPELAKAIVKTQRDAVERQAKEMLNGAVGEALDGELARLQQKSAERSESLEQQRQAEALRLLEEEEAEEEHEREKLERDREHQLQNTLASRTGAASQPPGDEDSGGEDQREDEEEAPPRLSRELVLDVASARAGLQAFNEEVLSPLKQKFSLSRRYIADSSALVSAAAGCALLLGHDPQTLRDKRVGTDTHWSWDRLRRLLTPSFAEAMLAFDPKAPRRYTDSANSLQFITDLLESKAPDEETQFDSPFAALLVSWISLAITARRKELRLQRARLRRTARVQRTPLPPLDELDSDFKDLEEEGD